MKQYFTLLTICIVTALSCSDQEPQFRIGLVTDVGRVDDRGFNQASWNGVVAAGRQLGLNENSYRFLETTDSKDYEDNIRQFTEQDFNIIVTVGFALGETTRKLAREYPDIWFIGVDQMQDHKLPNLIGLIFREEQAGYLAGYLAAQMTESRKIGAVLGSDMIPPVVAFREGFLEGAKTVQPDIEIMAAYHPGTIAQAFTDPEWGAATAAQMIDKGADVIFAAGGMTGNGALEEAAARTKTYCIGVDLDQWETVPAARPCLLSSAMKLIAPAMIGLIRDIHKGRNDLSGNFYGDVGLAPFHKFDTTVSQETKGELVRIHIAFQKGELKTEYKRN